MVFLPSKAMALENGHVTESLLQYVSVTSLPVLSMTREERERARSSLSGKIGFRALVLVISGSITKCHRLGDL